MKKIIGVLVLAAMLSGCWWDSPPHRWVENNKVLYSRAIDLCTHYEGVYLWGINDDFGKVKCYHKKVVCDAFENTCEDK